MSTKGRKENHTSSLLSDDSDKENKTHSIISDSSSHSHQDLNASIGHTPNPTSIDVERKTQFSNLLLVKKHPVISRTDLAKKISLSFLRTSIVVTFVGYFLALQPYDHTISNYFSNPSDPVKLIASLVLISLILASFFYLLNRKDDEEVESDDSSIEQSTLCEKIINACLFLAIITTIFTQSLLIPRLFITFIVQWLAPLSLSLSCLMFLVHSIFAKKNCTPKTITSLLFFSGMFGGLILTLNAFQAIPTFMSHSFWSDKFLPITLLSSIFSCSMLALEPFTKICCKKKSSEVEQNKIFSNITNVTEHHHQQHGYMDSETLQEIEHPQHQKHKSASNIDDIEVTDEFNLMQ